MKARPAMSLAEMAVKATGTGRLVCSKCNCPDFKTYKTQQGHRATFRYKECRHCGHRVLTTQQPEQVIRDVETRGAVAENDFDGDVV